MKMLNSPMNNLYEKWKDEFKPKEQESFMKKLLNIFKKKEYFFLILYIII